MRSFRYLCISALVSSVLLTALGAQVPAGYLPKTIVSADPARVDGRLTLAQSIDGVWGQPYYYPPTTPLPDSTSTGSDYVQYNGSEKYAPGTLATVVSTGGGLTTGTVYFLGDFGAADPQLQQVTFHTTLADALAGTNPVNLTASIQTRVVPYGIRSTTVYFTPTGQGNLVSLWNGTRVYSCTFAELSLALGTVTADTNYDVFLVDSGSCTLSLEKLAWSTDTARATDVTIQNGMWAKSGDATRRYLGTFRTVSTTETEDSGGSSLVNNTPCKRFLWNAQNQHEVYCLAVELNGAATWTYTTATIRQANADTTNEIRLIKGLEDIDEDVVFATARSSNTTAGVIRQNGIGFDNTTAWLEQSTIGNITNDIGTGSPRAQAYAQWVGRIPLGYHRFTWLENSTASGTTTWYFQAPVANNITNGIRSLVSQ